MIPAFVNARADGAENICDGLARHGGFDIHRLDPADVRERVRRAVDDGVSRVLVAGGDGSLSAAAAVLAGTTTELAVVPGGTLNHLANDLGIPASLPAAIALAHQGRARPIDIGRLNGVPFLNTSSVGAYVAFVRLRERLERTTGYRVASVLAATRLLIGMTSSRVTLQVGGVSRTYTTPLVFIGVGERELKLPTLGKRTMPGQSGLHVMVVRRRSGARVLALALAAAARGITSVARTPALDAFLVNRCTIETANRTAAIDGELISIDSPMEYEVQTNALRVVTP